MSHSQKKGFHVGLTVADRMLWFTSCLTDVWSYVWSVSCGCVLAARFRWVNYCHCMVLCGTGKGVGPHSWVIWESKHVAKEVTVKGLVQSAANGATSFQKACLATHQMFFWADTSVQTALVQAALCSSHHSCWLIELRGHVWSIHHHCIKPIWVALVCANAPN